MEDLLAPASYQGAKHHVADGILDVINPSQNQDFWDVCCGSGAISLALRRRGHPPSMMRMVDAGPWGDLWSKVGAGKFSLERLAWWCEQVPTALCQVRDFMRELSLSRVDADSAYVFLLLQAASFGGRPVRVVNGKWATHGFRDLWFPTATSSRRSPVNPMMPMPKTILSRMGAICLHMEGVQAFHQDAMTVEYRSGAVYADPDYQGVTTDYGHALNPHALAAKVGRPVWVSEARPLSECAHAIRAGSKKGGVSGAGRKVAHEEWLSLLSP